MCQLNLFVDAEIRILYGMSIRIAVATFVLFQERRLEKKMNKEAFKDEEIRQHKQMINLNQNLKGIKIV